MALNLNPRKAGFLIINSRRNCKLKTHYMAKVAKLVYVSLMTRVIVEESATEDDIIKAAKPQFIEKIGTDLGDNIESIEDDEECPHIEKTKELELGDSVIWSDPDNDKRSGQYVISEIKGEIYTLTSPMGSRVEVLKDDLKPA